MPDHRQIVSDEQVGEFELLPQVLQKINDLCLNGHVQRRDWFVEDQELRVYLQRAGDTDPLALSAAELMRVSCSEVGLERNAAEQLVDPLASRPRSANPAAHHRLF